MKFRMEINLDNAAFADYPGSELAQILRTIADTNGMDGGELPPLNEPVPILDRNGNRVGCYAVVVD